MKKLIIVVFALLTTVIIQAQTQVIAHRGFWDTPGSAQNSIASLVKADSIGCYGAEFDVRLTKDNQLVVNHDSSFKGRFMEKTNVSRLTKLSLSNGETLPTLQEYLARARELNIRLILELKKHGSDKRETQAIEQIVAMVREMGLEKRMEYITFSLHATQEFIRLAPAGTPVYNLDGKLSPRELKEMGCAGPDYHYSVFKKHPEWIQECHDLGMKVNAWTVNKKEDMQWLISQKADFITTDNPVLLQEIIK
ncbi:MAG: glycerophosphodiester phosphodiesterase [Bacteroides sp.]|nr:glycerophosphodiester phosphodiesterase [Bacteroides sp.]